MMIQLLFIGKTKEKYVSEGMEDFLARLKRFIRVDVHELPDEKITNDTAAVKDKEGERILAARKEESYLVCLDEHGRQMSSLEFAAFMKKAEMRDITFAVGGALGHSSRVIARADLLLSFSKMTFNHQMVRLFLAEQLYRAYAINRNIPYHK